MKNITRILTWCGKWAKKRYTPLAVFTIYKLIFDWNYVYFIAPLYGYSGFGYSPSLSAWVISITISVTVFWLIYDPKKEVSNTILSIFLLVTYVPLSSYFAFSGQSIRYFLYVSFCWVFVKLLLDISFEKWLDNDISTIINRTLGRLVSYKIIVIKLIHLMLLFICCVITILTLFGLYRYTDIASWFITLDITRVYEIRQDLDFPSWFSYIFTWQSNVIIPFLVTYLIYIKKYYLIILPLSLQIFMYLSTGTRAILLSIPLYILILVIFRFKYAFMTFATLIGAGVAAISSLVLFSWNGLFAHSLIVRRTFFVPPLVEYSYFNHFQASPMLFFSESRIGSLFGLSSPYPISSTRLISFSLHGTAITSTNTGFMASAFADMGFMGMIIIAVLFFVFIKYCCVVFRRLPLNLVIAALIVPVYSLANSAFFTSMLSHGIGIIVILLSLLALADTIKKINAGGVGVNE